MEKAAQFWKYSANGNHFILLDAWLGASLPQESQVKEWCDPVFGVGADGVAWIGPCEGTEDFRFRLWNSDGGEAEMCGNASRIAAWHFLRHHAHGKEMATFATMNGSYVATQEGGRLWVKMTEHRIDATPDPQLFKKYDHWYFVNTGVPHLVFEVPEVGHVDLMKEAPPWRHHETFPKGTNVDYYTVDDHAAHRVRLRVFERGVEGETWSCGTGIAATSWALRTHYGWNDHVEIVTKGGEHHVRWDHDGQLWFSGAIHLSFIGTFA